MAATSGAVERFDGDPDQSYLEDINAFMNRTFGGWDHYPDRYNFLQSGTPSRGYDYQRKFPFSTHRFNERCYSRKNDPNRKVAQHGAVSYFNSPSTSRPEVYGSQVVANAKTTLNNDPRQSEQELQVAKVSL